MLVGWVYGLGAGVWGWGLLGVGWVDVAWVGMYSAVPPPWGRYSRTVHILLVKPRLHNLIAATEIHNDKSRNDTNKISCGRVVQIN